MTTIEMSDEDAKLWLAVLENEALLKPLLQLGVKPVRGGRVTLHFNHLGHLMSAETNVIVYLAK